MHRCVSCVVLIAFTLNLSWGQTLIPRSEKPADPNSAPAAQPTPTLIPLTVPTGTPLKVALDHETRIRQVGQTVHGKIVDPVYAFDKLVIPAGADVVGKISAIDQISKKTRTLAAMNGDLSPARPVHLKFSDLVLANGQHLSLHTNVNQAASGVLEFVPAAAPAPTSKKDEAKNAAARRISEAKQEAKREWIAVKRQLHESGKMHRVERLAVAQLPYRPQYLESGTSFNAELEEPLDFGTEPLKPAVLANVGTPPPSGSVVHAVLVSPLSSSTTKKGDPVEAVITQPLIVSDHLLIPEGSRLQGTVLQARPARRFHRNGQLRIVFHEVVPPSGIAQNMEGSLEGVEVSKGEHLQLDSEGGAQVTTPKTRYLSTAISVMLATSSMDGHEHDRDGDFRGGGSDVGSGAANGASGFRFLGTVVGALAHSRAITSGLGFYGAATSVYSHFLSRGSDVVYAKDTSMMIGFGNSENRSGSKDTDSQQPKSGPPALKSATP